MERLVQDVDASAAGELRQRLAQLEGERVALGKRLAEAERLISVDRSRQRLAQLVARREGGDIVFEALLRAPPDSKPGTRLVIEVLAVRNAGAVSAGLAHRGPFSFEVDRSKNIEVDAPKVADTIQGRLTSDAQHLLLLLRPVGSPSDTEALLLPVNRDP